MDNSIQGTGAGTGPGIDTAGYQANEAAMAGSGDGVTSAAAAQGPDANQDNCCEENLRECFEALVECCCCCFDCHGSGFGGNTGCACAGGTCGC